MTPDQPVIYTPVRAEVERNGIDVVIKFTHNDDYAAMLLYDQLVSALTEGRPIDLSLHNRDA